MGCWWSLFSSLKPSGTMLHMWREEERGRDSPRAGGLGFPGYRGGPWWDSGRGEKGEKREEREEASQEDQPQSVGDTGVRLGC